MGTPFIGEIRMFGANFAPAGWALCQGQLLAISQNDALFSLFGTTYGGDGQATFALPDLRGRIPIHAGSGPDLTPRTLGQKGGEENVTLTTAQLPVHKHTFSGTNSNALRTDPTGSFPAQSTADLYKAGSFEGTDMNTGALQSSGQSQPHPNLMPFQCINFIVALVGVYPSQF
jgi:microcystin-dependent protein